ncbi:MAG: hypothetical protein DLM60_19000 [Pseudonocardiales bacterium]|nr:MAG: hypothetical protein DLM60_19000 [Pseudonocardiales bacterium]
MPDEDELVRRYDDLHGGAVRARSAAEAIRRLLPEADQQLRARGDRSFRQLVKDVPRVGLAHLDRQNAAPLGPFTRAVSLGAPRLPDVDDAGAHGSASRGAERLPAATWVARQ